MVSVLRSVRLFDGETFGEATDLAFADGVIVDVSSLADMGAVEDVDGAGGFVLPGFIDCHVHLYGPETLTELTRFGVTTALDMSSPPPLVQALRAMSGGSDIRSGMMALSSPTSAHAQRMKDIPAAAECLVADVSEVPAAVARRVAQGADYIKVVVDLPGFDQETVDAIVAEAHRHGLITIAHASRSDAVAMSISAGIDVLTHVPLDRPITVEQADGLAAAGTIVVPTLTMMKGIVERLGLPPGVPGPRYEAAADSVANLQRAGVPVLVGTDANKTAAAPFSPTMGESLHDELALLVAAGLTPAQALRGATSEAADRFGLSDRGRLVAGARADIVLLAADPTEDIAASRDVRGVWIAGDRVVAAS
ncbi:MAG TPA: amidohydrolase family protein [Phycicoccus sp.]|nr:amidohydrolase family protein [Phycicoccus sp.]